MMIMGNSTAISSVPLLAMEPASQNLASSSVSKSRIRSDVVHPPSRAVMTTPARASFPGVAPPSPKIVNDSPASAF